MKALLVSLTLLLAASVALADGAKPAVLGFTEVAPGQFDVVFRVPRSGNRIPALRPVLPDACQVVVEPEVEVSPGEQVTRWRISAAPWEVAGQAIRIDGLAAALNETLVRFRFLDGAIVTRILMPEAPETEFPSRVARSGDAAGPAAADPHRIRAVVTDGALHALSGPGHWLLLLGLALVGRFAPVLRALTAFALAHLVGVVVAPLAGGLVPLPVAEALLAAAGVVAATRRSGLVGLAAAAGLLHGAALGGATAAPVLTLIGTTVGIDTVQILVGLAAVAAIRAVPRVGLRTVASYAVGVGGVFFALLSATGTASVPQSDPGAPLLLSLIPPASINPSSVALNPSEDGPVRVFLAVEPGEVRVEAVLHAGVFLEDRGVIPVAEQDAVKGRLAELLGERVQVGIDGTKPDPMLTRIDFVERGVTGVLERPTPVPEPFADARIGAVLVFPVKGVPDRVDVSWGIAPDDGPVAATVIDPERTFVTEGDRISWKNELREPPPPEPSEVERRRPRLRVSVLSILLVVGGLVWLGTRRGRSALGVTASRVGLAAAAFAAPILPVPVPLPSRSIPEAAEAKSIAEALLANVHRAFDIHDENDVYERLAVSVTGDELTDVYLEHRRNLLLAAQGGARARADSVEIDEVREVEAAGDGGFRAEVGWRASGFVVHFGHRHFRRNVYRAAVTVVPEGDAWKIRDIEVREKRRVR